MSGKLLGLHAQTPLHPSSGTALGTVDLPIQRERHTKWPLIPGSALKGILQDACRDHLSQQTDLLERERFDDNLNDDAEQRKSRRSGSNSNRSHANATLDLNLLFGPPSEGAGDFAGAIRVTDARILAFPVRSAQGVFAWISCPAALDRLERDAKIAGKTVNWKAVDVPVRGCLCDQDSPCLGAGEVAVLEELDFKRDSTNSIDYVAKWIVEHLLQPEFKYLAARFPKHFLLLPDDDFTHYVRHATEVTARIALDYDTKTVKNGALFYQEFLPAESILSSVVLASPSRSSRQPKSAEEMLTNLQTWINRDRIAQLENPNHPAAARTREFSPLVDRDGQPIEQREHSGRVVFHDAWPLVWPKLQMDILNSHHPAYYQGKGEQPPPGDWEDPIPVYFLSVVPRTRFQFSISARRTEDQKLIELALGWLVGALEQSGAGAKTNAGYGSFQIEDLTQPVRRSLNATWLASQANQARLQRSFSLTLATPAFLAGAESENPAAFTSNQEHPGTSPSRYAPRNMSLASKMATGRKSLSDYRLSRSRSRFIRRSNSSAEWGGVGSKSRKGFGNVRLPAEFAQGTTTERIEVLQQQSKELRAKLRLKSGKSESPALERMLRVHAVATPWVNYWVALDRVGDSAQAFAQSKKHHLEKKALGLPRNVRALYIGSFRAGKDVRDRHAAPIHVRLESGVNGCFVAEFIAFPADRLPTATQSQLFLTNALQEMRQNLINRTVKDAQLGQTAAVGSRTSVTSTPSPPSGPKLRTVGARVQAKLASEKTKKGGWLAKYGHLTGPIQNSPDVPGDRQSGDEVTLIVKVSKPTEIAFRWPTPADDASNKDQQKKKK